jgi:branched-subunit amino acid aminotransferase/4-amino-4-deoxychorismate lyase
MNQLWCNGKWMDAGNFAIPGTDRGATHGLGFFETMLAVNGRVPFADLHLARLAAAMKRLRWPMPDGLIVEVLLNLLEKNALTGCIAKIRLAVTAGSGGLRDITAGADSMCWIAAGPFTATADSLKLMISPWRRNEHSPLSGLKCSSYAENLVALDHARRLGRDETLFLNTAGDLCEAAMANVFLIKNESLSTPGLDSGCLPGVARAVVLDLAEKAGVSCHETRLGKADLESADGIFLTSATRGPVSVSQLDSRIFPDAPLVRRMTDAWRMEVIRRCGD